MTTLSKSVEYVCAAIENGVVSPIVVGINGPQGSGKTYLAEHLRAEIVQRYPRIGCVSFSIDDFYLTHAQQKQLTHRARLDHNRLWQGRGLPGTHDVRLCTDFLTKLRNGETDGATVPVYDKSAHAGEGDRVAAVAIGESRVDLVIVEGWFNGYMPLDDDQLRLHYLAATGTDDNQVLCRHRLYHIKAINECLNEYVNIWKCFTHFIFIDSDYHNVYQWRLEQEHTLIKKTGLGMTDDQVVLFVQRYMPMYELYYSALCTNGYKGVPNMRLRVSAARELVDSQTWNML